MPAEDSLDILVSAREDLEMVDEEEIKEMLASVEDKDEALAGSGSMLAMLRDLHGLVRKEIAATDPKTQGTRLRDLQTLKEQVVVKYRAVFEAFNSWANQIQIEPEPFTTLSEKEQHHFEKVKSIVEESVYEAQPETDSNIIYDQDNTMLIKGATLDKLIEIFIYRSLKYFKFDESFFLLYTAFAKPPKVLGKLISIFNQENKNSNKPIMERVLYCLEYWVTNHIYDFDFGTILVLLNFLNSDAAASPLSTEATTLATHVVQLRDRAIRDGRMKKDFNLLDWSPREIAEQLTLIEFNIFQGIKPRECLGVSWAKENKMELAPHLCALIERVTSTARWVTSCILSETDKVKRGELISKFIAVATEFHKLNNFNGLYEIVAGLSASSVYRLNGSWDCVSETSKQKFKFFEQLVSPPYDMIKTAMAKATLPSLPMIGKYLFDFTFIEENSKDVVVVEGTEIPDLINYGKFRRFANLLRDIHMYQRTPYGLGEIPYLQKTLSATIFENLMDDDKAYEVSLVLEPRRRPSRV